jgi:hypothetical protein
LQYARGLRVDAPRSDDRQDGHGQKKPDCGDGGQRHTGTSDSGGDRRKSKERRTVYASVSPPAAGPQVPTGHADQPLRHPLHPLS